MPGSAASGGPASTPATTLSTRVRVRLFASLREAAGWGEQSVRIDGCQATPLALWHQLGLGALPGGVRVAINHQFASPHAPLADGDELAFLPPITGG